MKKKRGEEGKRGVKENGNRPILVLGYKRGKLFAQTLTKTGLSPTFLNSMEGLLHALSHSQARAILVDREQGKADELELVLNVRDMDEEIPIVLVGAVPEQMTDKILERQHATFLIRKPITDSSLVEELKTLTETVPHP
jgi:DNA-binding NtrC family response regulator